MVACKWKRGTDYSTSDQAKIMQCHRGGFSFQGNLDASGSTQDDVKMELPVLTMRLLRRNEY